MSKQITTLGTFLGALTIPFFACAHEVYVLNEQTIQQALAAESQNPFSAYSGNEYNFFFWAFVSFVVLSTILLASTFHFFEKQFNRALFFLKHFAHPLVRLTVGTSLISFGWYGGLFGPELLFSQLFGDWAGLAQIFFVIFGALITLGIWVRATVAVVLGVFAYAISMWGWYVFTYTDHLGALLLLLILGSGPWSLKRFFIAEPLTNRLRAALHHLSPYSFPLMRMFFGFSVMFAALYAKFIHSELALQVVIQYDLIRYFPFDPLFVVLGTFSIEFLAGLMMFAGVAVRWTALFLIFWLTLSLLYFQEAVWPHIILFGLGLAILCHGYDRWSLEGRLLRSGGREPVL